MTFLKNLKIVLILVITTTVITNGTQAQEVEHTEMYKSVETTTDKLNKNKALVVEFIEAMRTSNVDKLRTMITDDFSWWIIGKPEYLATAGEHDTAYFLGFFKGAVLFPEGTDFKTTSMISEGNVVAAEAEFKAKTAMGTDYENSYHFLFIIENGKVQRMKEYMDTYHAKVTFGL